MVTFGCIISFLYIKPQQRRTRHEQQAVVLYRFSTSNHNLVVITHGERQLYYIVSLHQTTTLLVSSICKEKLYYIVSLHQTTTWSEYGIIYPWLYYIVSLHQTTTNCVDVRLCAGCIISFLYIKPQQHHTQWEIGDVVLYRFSTSNHNLSKMLSFSPAVVLYRFSTSNHNLSVFQCYPRIVVLYRFSTSNHNSIDFYKKIDMLYYIVSLHQTTTAYLTIEYAAMLYYIVSLHQTTTSTLCISAPTLLYYIVSLHQTTTSLANLSKTKCCIISFLYIKPQRNV